MFEIQKGANHELILSGRFDASQVDKAKPIFAAVSEDTIVNFAKLIYISSAGLGILLATQKRLMERGQALRLININSHIKDVFRFSGFDQIFDIEN